VAASGEKVAGFAGTETDGVLATSARGAEFCRDVVFGTPARAAASAGRDPAGLERILEIKVSYDREPGRALAETRIWAAMDFLHEETGDPSVLESLAAARQGSGPGRWLVASDPDEHVEQLRPFLAIANQIVFHSPTPDQVGFIRRYAAEVLPRLRDAND
jgi:coenzyme F420-dependent glucose-6-phosphate dehydrogenase